MRNHSATTSANRDSFARAACRRERLNRAEPGHIGVRVGTVGDMITPAARPRSAPAEKQAYMADHA
jgi:hypothetical protein